jgi:hypothetical protein
MTYLIVLIIGLATGYLIGSRNARYQRSNDLQALIDQDATKRRADGIHRKGDLLTEHERAECAAGRSREVAR